MQFKLPPVLYNEEGTVRKVGFELEYSNLSIEESAQIIRDLYGGNVQQESRFRQKVVNTSLGDFTIEFDLTLLTDKSYRKAFDAFNIYPEDVKLGKGTLADEVETALERIVGKVFPYEIACPPIPCTELQQLERLRDQLYQHRAEGTKSFLTNAFGTHINVEVPALTTEALVRYLKAFLLLYPWLLEIGETDFARKMSPFIAPFPAAYVDLVLSPVYQPDLRSFISDYHRYNPDRNRPLDLYPVLAAFNNGILTQYKDIGKVKARNTFHYRLPNSSISQPDWSLAKEWNNWVAIEELANEHEKLAQMSQEYLTLKKHTLIGFEKKWIRRTKQWLT